MILQSSGIPVQLQSSPIPWPLPGGTESRDPSRLRRELGAVGQQQPSQALRVWPALPLKHPLGVQGFLPCVWALRLRVVGLVSVPRGQRVGTRPGTVRLLGEAPGNADRAGVLRRPRGPRPRPGSAPLRGAGGKATGGPAATGWVPPPAGGPVRRSLETARRCRDQPRPAWPSGSWPTLPGTPGSLPGAGSRSPAEYRRGPHRTDRRRPRGPRRRSCVAHFTGAVSNEPSSPSGRDANVTGRSPTRAEASGRSLRRTAPECLAGQG